MDVSLRNLATIDPRPATLPQERFYAKQEPWLQPHDVKEFPNYYVFVDKLVYVDEGNTLTWHVFEEVCVLPENANTEKISATYLDRVLTVTVEKKASPEPQMHETIEVQVASKILGLGLVLSLSLCVSTLKAARLHILLRLEHGRRLLNSDSMPVDSLIPFGEENESKRKAFTIPLNAPDTSSSSMFTRGRAIKLLGGSFSLYHAC
ncbi:hypothetical protein SADUNF_Sadunf06G0177200 [Salix dunnii]|uniref:SHSP domain-containing protein n=1 Tax=Salix dunnii TaxID=1413687 RepID=A0A835K2S9_9ROSI|nr:hypothetical protein SADUNF_Sadunf06G0177200 [Salix dunnii]